MIEIDQEVVVDVLNSGTTGCGRVLDDILYHPVIGSYIPENTEVLLRDYGQFQEIFKRAIRSLAIIRTKRNTICSSIVLRFTVKNRQYLSTSDFVEMSASDSDYTNSRFSEANLIAKTIVDFHRRIRSLTVPYGGDILQPSDSAQLVNIIEQNSIVVPSIC